MRAHAQGGALGPPSLPLVPVGEESEHLLRVLPDRKAPGVFEVRGGLEAAGWLAAVIACGEGGRQRPSKRSASNFGVGCFRVGALQRRHRGEAALW